jgi:hypothetical protein
MPVFRRIGGADKKMALVELLRIIANELTSENIKMMDDEGGPWSTTIINFSDAIFMRSGTFHFCPKSIHFTDVWKF